MDTILLALITGLIFVHTLITLSITEESKKTFNGGEYVIALAIVTIVSGTIFWGIAYSLNLLID